MSDIPQEVRAFITGQLGLFWDRSDDYPWHTTRDYHVAQVRKCTGWRFLTAQDKIELEQWLRKGAAYEGQSAEMLLDAACGRLRRLRVELPAEGELQRLVNIALAGFFQDIQLHIAEAMPTEVRARIDNLLMVADADFVSEFKRMKADSGKPGVDQLQGEIDKLRANRAVGVPAEPFALVPWKVLQTLKRRATNEIATEMRKPPGGDSVRSDGLFSPCARDGSDRRSHAHGH